MSLAGYR